MEEQITKLTAEELATIKYDAMIKGMEAIGEHSVPAPETKLFMEKINTQILDLQKDFTELKSDIKERISSLPTNDNMKLFVKEAIDGALNACDNRYAPKRVETVLNWLAGVIGVALIGGAITLFYKLIEYLITFK